MGDDMAQNVGDTAAHEADVPGSNGSQDSILP